MRCIVGSIYPKGVRPQNKIYFKKQKIKPRELYRNSARFYQCAMINDLSFFHWMEIT